MHSSSQPTSPREAPTDSPKWPDGDAGGHAIQRLRRAASDGGLLLVVVLGLAGCSIGPGMVTRDRFDSQRGRGRIVEEADAAEPGEARHSDAPVFLDVGQIVSGYTVQSTFSAVGNVFNSSGVVPGVPSSSIGLGAQGQFIDRPTITYTH